MHRYASRLTNRQKTRHDLVGITILYRQNFAVIARRYASHGVMHGGHDWDWAFEYVNIREYPPLLKRFRQPLLEYGGIKMRKVDVHIVLVRPTSSSLAHLLNHAAGHVIARG